MTLPSPRPYPLPPFGNRFAELPPAFHTRLQPTPLPAPYLVGFSEDAAASIALPRPQADDGDFLDIFAGNRIAPGSTPLSAV